MIILKGQPLSTQTIYKYACRGKHPAMYMTAKGKQMKDYYRYTAIDQWNEPVSDKPCEMEINLFFKSKHKHDIDNFSKLCLDSLTGVVYEDDSQITKLTITKEMCKENPRVEIAIKQ